MSILCSLKNIHLAFGDKVLFDGAALNISTEDRIGLLGLNGTGKSTLFSILNQTTAPDISTPPFEFDKAKGATSDGTPFSVFQVPQDFILPKEEHQSIRNYLYTFYPHFKKWVEEGSYEELEEVGGWDIIQGYESYLRFFGFEDLDQSVLPLSGGEQKKILLSIGFASPASLILWDEPTNHLDMETIRTFEEQLEIMNRSYILITHDRYLLSKLTNKILHIQRGEIKEFKGGYTDYLEFLAEQEAARLKLLERLKNNLRRETAWMRQGIKARGTRSKKRVENYLSLAQKVANIKSQAKQQMNASLMASKRKTKKLVEMQEVGISFDNRTLFKEISLIIRQKDKVGLLGNNGVGKSTLTHLIAGIQVPSTGRVEIAEHLVIKKFSQTRDELDPNMTAFQLIGEGNDFIHLPDGRQKHVMSYLSQFLFSKDDVHRTISSFSGGEKNRLQLACNLKTPADLWIFDEPTNDLDLETVALLEEKLTEFAGALILISHDRSFLATVTNKTWLISEGELEVFEGGYDQVEAFLEVREIEKKLAQAENKEIKKLKQKESKESADTPRRLTYKEKIRREKLPEIISQTEDQLSQLEQQVANFDFSAMDQSTDRAFKELNQTKDQMEEALLSLYEELETLSSMK